MKVKICNCIDNNPIREFDLDQSNLTVLELLQHSLQRLNLQNLKDNVTVYSDGQEVPSEIWAVFKLNKTKCLKFVIKPQDFFSIAMIIIALAVAVYTMVMLKKLKTNDKNQESGSSIYDPNAQGNKAKLEDPIPEQFGLVKAFPKHEFDDIEHGSSDWSENGEQYQVLNKNKGIVLAEKNYLPVDKRGNVNVLVVGRIWCW